MPRLIARRHNREEEIGGALGEHEKRDLAESLSRALHRVRNPVFDNPQLKT